MYIYIYLYLYIYIFIYIFIYIHYLIYANFGISRLLLFSPGLLFMLASIPGGASTGSSWSVHSSSARAGAAGALVSAVPLKAFKEAFERPDGKGWSNAGWSCNMLGCWNIWSLCGRLGNLDVIGESSLKMVSEVKYTENCYNSHVACCEWRRVLKVHLTYFFATSRFPKAMQRLVQRLSVRFSTVVFDTLSTYFGLRQGVVPKVFFLQKFKWTLETISFLYCG